MVRAARAAERTGSLATALVIGVATNPGVTALQQTPWGAQASDWDRVSPASPALDAPYPPLLPNARTACWEATLMIRPQPRRAIAGPKRWPSTNGAVRFTASTPPHCSSVCSPRGGRGLRGGRVHQDVRFPEGRGGFPGRPLGLGRVGEIGPDPGRCPAGCPDGRGRPGQAFLAAGQQHDPGAGQGESPGHGVADAGTAPGDQGYPAVQGEEAVEKRGPPPRLAAQASARA